MTVDDRVRLGDTTNAPAQWAANLLGPVALLLGLELAYIAVQPACRSGVTVLIHASFAGAFVLALLGAAIGLRERRRWGSAPSSDAGDPVARSRFMVTTGTVVSLLSALVIVAQWLATLFFNPCQ